MSSASRNPWLHADSSRPRRAGVSAFGFGGTNFHAVLEAYDRDTSTSLAAIHEWPAELLIWEAESAYALVTCLEGLLIQLDDGAKPRLRDVAHALAKSARRIDGPRLAIVAESLEDLRRNCERRST